MEYTHRRCCVLIGLLGLISTAHAQDVVTYYHPDASGSPTAATDEYGNVLWREAYAPYGERLRQDLSPRTNRLWFTGHPQDEDSGLIYAGARHYDPVVGRFLSVDPAAAEPDNQFAFNRYAYGNNNPYRFADPDGESSRVIVNTKEHTVVVKVPVVFSNYIIGGGRVSRAMAGANQQVTDPQGNQWTVTFERVSGKLRYDDGTPFGNMFAASDSLPPGWNEAHPIAGTRADKFLLLRPDASDKAIGHEIGHAAGLADRYLEKPFRSDPRYPHNLMNIDDSTATGFKLNWQQLQEMMSPKSGNHVVEKETLRMKVRDAMGF